MKKRMMLFALVLILLLLCGCAGKRELNCTEAKEKLDTFMQVFSYSEKKEFLYDALPATETNGVKQYPFVVTYLTEDGEEKLFGTYCVSAEDGSIRVAED